MPKIAYITKKFSQGSLDIIHQANEIIEEYVRLGFDLTLRQIYYQFVARALLPNSDRSYKRLGSIINDARLAGLIDWERIKDRTRFVRTNSHWDSPASIVEACANQFEVDKWDGQEYYLEVWIEKDALVGVIENVCKDNDIAFFSCRGYSSQTALWEAAQRILRKSDEPYTVEEDELGFVTEDDRKPVVLHLGDHDPSGIDMTRDIRDRLNLFSAHHDGPEVVVERIALNMDQIQLYNPPPNPAKLSDSRARQYIERYGYNSWELDALDPTTLEGMVSDAINKYRDYTLYSEHQGRERAGRRQLNAVARDWHHIAEDY
jgi:hypothetical protein